MFLPARCTCLDTGEGPAQKVDVIDLDRRSLTEAKSGEGTSR